MKGWTYVRTLFSELKFPGCIGYQIFLPMVLRYARFARESSTENLLVEPMVLLCDFASSQYINKTALQPFYMITFKTMEKANSETQY